MRGLWGSVFRWIDPGGGWQYGRLGGAPLETDGMGCEGGIKGDGALCGERGGGSVMHGSRGHPPDPAVAMIMVVPAKELLAVSTSIFDRAEAIREVGPVLQGLGAPCKGAISQWELDPPGNCCSSR